jgi:hypothetical protein
MFDAWFEVLAHWSAESLHCTPIWSSGLAQKLPNSEVPDRIGNRSRLREQASTMFAHALSPGSGAREGSPRWDWGSVRPVGRVQTQRQLGKAASQWGRRNSWCRPASADAFSACLREGRAAESTEAVPALRPGLIIEGGRGGHASRLTAPDAAVKIYDATVRVDGVEIGVIVGKKWPTDPSIKYCPPSVDNNKSSKSSETEGDREIKGCTRPYGGIDTRLFWTGLAEQPVDRTVDGRMPTRSHALSPELGASGATDEPNRNDTGDEAALARLVRRPLMRERFREMNDLFEFLVALGCDGDMCPDTQEEISPVDSHGIVRFVSQRVEDSDDDEYLSWPIPPHAVLRRKSEAILCWRVRADVQETIDTLCAGLGTVKSQIVPLPGHDGWRCILAQDALPYAVEGLNRVYGP